MIIESMPAIDKAVEVLRKAIASREVIIIVGRCIVDYEGRSRSRLTAGERIVIIKPDGSLLVHRPTGYKPVNWQPDSKIMEAGLKDNMLYIKSIREKPRETVTIFFDEIKLIYTGKLVDPGEFVMYLDEHEIRDILYEHPEVLEEGLRITEKEKPIGIGYIDLFGIDSKNNPVIIEIKRVTASREAVHQLYQYVLEYAKKTGKRPRGILVAQSFTKNAIEALRRLGLEWKEISLQKLWREYYKKTEKTHVSIMDFL